MRRTLWLVIGAVLCWPVVASLAASRVGAGRSSASHVVALARSSRVRSVDLRVTAVRVALREGDVLTGAATIRNKGSGRAPASTGNLAWRSSATAGVVQVGRFRVVALAAGRQTKQRFSFPVPKGAKGGRYAVSICVDVLGQVQAHTKSKSRCRSAGVVTVPALGMKGYGPTGSGPSPPSGSGGSTSPSRSAPPSSPPATFIDSGPSGPVDQTSATFTFHGSEADDSFHCSLDGSAWAPCTSPQTYSGLADGARTFQVRSVNAAGEVDPTPASASFTVEATPPQTTITSAPSGRVPIGEVSISFASTEAGSSFQCSLDGTAYSPCSSPYVIKDPAAGPHTFSVHVTNQAGVKETVAPPPASWSSVEPQHDLCGTISSNTTIGPNYASVYTLDNCTVDVPSGLTLTVAPGAVVKASGGGDPNVYGIYSALQVEG